MVRPQLQGFIPYQVERFSEVIPETPKALSGISLCVRQDPVSAQQHFMPQRARDDPIGGELFNRTRYHLWTEQRPALSEHESLIV
jgi:hypothetical protein